MKTGEAVPGGETIRHTGWRDRPFGRALRELGLVAALFLVYKMGRMAAVGRVSQALDNADLVWRVQHWLHLPSELAIQHALLASGLLVRLANGFYAYLHFPATAVCLIWLYLRRPAHYLWTRRMLAWLTAVALAVHLLFPLAPPRLAAATGMVDTGTRYGPSVYGSPATDALSNQYAAMPSLHVGWALVVAIAFITITTSRWRWLWLAHPLITLLVVVGTGNHYWLDAIVAVTLLGAIALVLPTPATGRRPVLIPAQPAPAQPVLAQPVLAQPVLAQPVLAQPIPTPAPASAPSTVSIN